MPKEIWSVFPPRVRNWEQMDEHIHGEDSLSQEPAQTVRIPQKEGGRKTEIPPGSSPVQDVEQPGMAPLSQPRSIPALSLSFPFLSHLLPGSIKCLGLGGIKLRFMGCQVFCTGGIPSKKRKCPWLCCPSPALSLERSRAEHCWVLR